MKYRISFIGPECSGKTTLVEALAEKFSLNYNPEYARKYALKVGHELNVNDVLEIGQGQFHSQEVYCKLNSNQAFGLFDTDLLSTLFYSIWYYNHHPSWLEDLIRAQGQFIYFFTYPDPEWEEDPSRAVGAKRMEMYHFFERMLKERGISFTLVQGNLNARMNLMERKIEEIVIG